MSSGPFRHVVACVDDSPATEAVVRLAHALGLKVVAEGVETQDQADILAQLHCDELQGFLFARPMSEHTLLNWLRQRGSPVPPTQVRVAPDPVADVPGREDDDLVTAWSDLETSAL